RGCSRSSGTSSSSSWAGTKERRRRPTRSSSFASVRSSRRRRAAPRSRLALEGWPVPTRRVLVRDSDGNVVPLLLDTIGVRNDEPPHALHLLREATNAADEPTSSQAASQWEGRLTRRQLELLRLMADGLSARAIAERLTLQESTVRNHIHAI